MTWDFGVDFRETSTFVTDPAYAVYELGTDIYPVSRTNANSITTNIGWPTTCHSEDRISTYDAILAGYNSRENGSPLNFTIALPESGVYTIDIGLGTTETAPGEYAQLLDGTTLLTTFSKPLLANYYIDATGSSVYATTIWTGTPKNFTFSTTSLVITLGNSADDGNYSYIAFVRATQVVASEDGWWLPRSLNAGFQPMNGNLKG